MHISAATSPGCSSGALVDDQGRLVGLLSLQSVERQNFTFALPVEWISELSNRTQPVPIGTDKGDLTGLTVPWF